MIILGNRNSEESHRRRSVDGMALLAERDDVLTGLMDQHQPSMPTEAYSTTIGSGYVPPASGLSLQSPALPESGAPKTSATSPPRISTITRHLEKEQDDTVIFGVLYRKDLHTLLPDVRHILSEAIINGYLKCLTGNPRRKGDIPNSHGKIAMIGTTDQPGLLKDLAAFSTIFIPIKLDAHWILAVLYPGSSGQARSEVYDSRNATNIMTTTDVSSFLEHRLGDEYTRADWIASAGKCSLLHGNSADSGLYLLANAKSIIYDLEMIDLNSDEKRLSFRWQIAIEISRQSISKKHFSHEKR